MHLGNENKQELSAEQRARPPTTEARDHHHTWHAINTTELTLVLHFRTEIIEMRF